MVRVLVIDHCQDFRDRVRFILESAGVEVLEARDALAGLQRSVEDEPDAVVVSETLIGLCGLEVAARLAAEPATKSLPVLLSADCIDAALRSAADEAGAADVVSRSACTKDFVASVHRSLYAAGVPWLRSAPGAVRESSQLRPRS